MNKMIIVGFCVLMLVSIVMINNNHQPEQISYHQDDFNQKRGLIIGQITYAGQGDMICDYGCQNQKPRGELKWN